MMKFKTFLLIAIFCFTGSLFATSSERDGVMWAEAYNGNFSLVHKLMLSRQPRGTNDEIMNQFIMAYVFYRMGNMEQIEPIFKGIDSYLEHKIANKG